MTLCIFAKTFVRPTVADVFRAVAKHHLRSMQFNFASAGMACTSLASSRARVSLSARG